MCVRLHDGVVSRTDPWDITLGSIPKPLPPGPRGPTHQPYLDPLDSSVPNSSPPLTTPIFVPRGPDSLFPHSPGSSLPILSYYQW